MKTKEQWLEEFMNKTMRLHCGFECSVSEESEEQAKVWIANALEQYAKEYCLWVVEKVSGERLEMFSKTNQYWAAGFQEGYNDASNYYESAMKKEIGV